MSHAITIRLLREGIAAAKAGNKPLTRELLRQAIELDPNNEMALLWLAGVAETPQESLGYLQRAIALNPENERAQKGIKAAYLHAGIAAAKAKQPQAREWLTEAAKRDPGNETVWVWLASVAEKPETAIGCLKKALAINPDNVQAQKGVKFFQSQLPSRPASTPGGFAKPAEPEPAYKCPFCHFPGEAAFEKCPGCNAMLAIGSAAAIIQHQGADVAKLKGAIDRLSAQIRNQPDPHVALNLGLAHLNVKQIDQALSPLETALNHTTEAKLKRSIQQMIGAVKAHHEAAERERMQKQLANQRTVLVVDDSPTIRKLVAMTLEKSGHVVVAAASAEEALDLLRSNGVPDMVLLDITMPGMDGYQLCKLLRSNRATAHLPIVMLSGKDGFFSKIRGQFAGSTEYITKPFQPAQLIDAVAKHCLVKNSPLAAGR